MVLRIVQNFEVAGLVQNQHATINRRINLNFELNILLFVEEYLTSSLIKDCEFMKFMKVLKTYGMQSYVSHIAHGQRQIDHKNMLYTDPFLMNFFYLVIM